MIDGDAVRRLVAKLTPGDEFSLGDSQFSRRVRVTFKDGTEIRVVLAPSQRMNVKIGTTMIPEFFMEDPDVPLG